MHNINPHCKYINIYIKIINNAIARKNILCKDIIDESKKQTKVRKTLKENLFYIEKHHILPNFLGDENTKIDVENFAWLTAREHFICHKLLYKSLKSKKSFYAFYRMSHTTKTHSNQRYNIKSTDYDFMREQLSEINSEYLKNRPKEQHPMWKKNHDDDTKAKISKSLSGKKRKKESIKKGIETKIKNNSIKRGIDHPNYGKPPSKESIDKNREANKKIKKTKEWNLKNSISNSGRIHIANTVTKERKRMKKEDAISLIESSNGVWIKLASMKPIPDYSSISPSLFEEKDSSISSSDTIE